MSIRITNESLNNDNSYKGYKVAEVKFALIYPEDYDINEIYEAVDKISKSLNSYPTDKDVHDTESIDYFKQDIDYIDRLNNK